MSALGIEWKGDLVRIMNDNRIDPPLGDVATPEGTIREVADMIGEALERSGGWKP